MTFMSGAAFFPEKSCSLNLGLSVEECTVGVTNPWNLVLQIHSFVDITKQKFLRKLIFRDYKMFRRILEEF